MSPKVACSSCAALTAEVARLREREATLLNDVQKTIAERNRAYADCSAWYVKNRELTTRAETAERTLGEQAGVRDRLERAWLLVSRVGPLYHGTVCQCDLCEVLAPLPSAPPRGEGAK